MGERDGKRPCSSAQRARPIKENAPVTETTKTGSSDRIESFEGPNRYLSNFGAGEAMYDGVPYDCAEKAFQAAKTLDMAVREQIRNATTPGVAKRLGRQAPLRKGWEEMKVGVMRDVVRSKFERNQDLARKLLATGDTELVEGNWWNDVFWGVCRGRGRNMLGKIIMDVRTELAKTEHG